MADDAVLQDDSEMTRARRALPGWHVWTVPVLQPPSTRWCGKPPGHHGAVAWGDSADELIEHAGEWAEQQRQAPEAPKPAPDDLGVDLASLSWERSGTGGGSLEVAVPAPPAGASWQRGDWVLMRVAGDPSGRVLAFDRNEWECFLDGARNGEFDDAGEPAGASS